MTLSLVRILLFDDPLYVPMETRNFEKVGVEKVVLEGRVVQDRLYGRLNPRQKKNLQRQN